MQVQAVGISWYRAEDYDRLKRIFSDGAKLPATFEEWHVKAQALHDRIASEGRLAVKAYIDPDTFPDWCKAHGKEADAQGRMAFANECAYKQARQKPQN